MTPIDAAKSNASLLRMFDMSGMFASSTQCFDFTEPSPKGDAFLSSFSLYGFFG